MVDTVCIKLLRGRAFVALIFLLLGSVLQCEAWVQPHGWSQRRLVSPTALSMVESVTMVSLDNHEEIGEELAGSVQRWLDIEWMPQDVHMRMGQSCKRSYIACREAGDDDLMLIMTSITDDLTSKWSEYDKDAFVNAWDISNYASDFLINKVGNIEGCQCSATIH
jgi:hypothetical protein